MSVDAPPPNLGAVSLAPQQTGRIVCLPHVKVRQPRLSPDRLRADFDC